MIEILVYMRGYKRKKQLIIHIFLITFRCSIFKIVNIFYETIIIIKLISMSLIMMDIMIIKLKFYVIID